MRAREETGKLRVRRILGARPRIRRHSNDDSQPRALWRAMRSNLRLQLPFILILSQHRGEWRERHYQKYFWDFRFAASLETTQCQHRRQQWPRERELFTTSEPPALTVSQTSAPWNQVPGLRPKVQWTWSAKVQSPGPRSKVLGSHPQHSTEWGERMGQGKVGLRRTINILPSLSSPNQGTTQCPLLRSLLGLSSCFSSPHFWTHFFLLLLHLFWAGCRYFWRHHYLSPPYQKQRSGRNDPRDRIIRHVTNGVGVITFAPLVSVTTLVILMSRTK